MSRDARWGFERVRRDFAALLKDVKNAEEVLRRADYRALNKVASKAMTASRRGIVSKVNLSQGYVKDRLTLEPATKARAVAMLVARFRPTTLSTYGARQLVSSAKRARGDARRGIPRGRKQAGVSVSVKRGNGRKALRGGFMIPLRAGKVPGGNGMGVFLRTGPGQKDISHRYGPSVDKVFSWVIPEIAPAIIDDLEKTVVNQLEYEVRKALKL